MNATAESPQKARVTGIRISDELVRALRKYAVDTDSTLPVVVAEILTNNVPEGARQYLQRA